MGEDSPATGGKLRQAASRGLCAGLFLGGLYLLAVAALALFRAPDCTGLAPAECALARDVAVSLGRRQALFGGALCLLALSVSSLLRRRRTR